MTREQVQDEKLDVQKALLQYESLHGRPVCMQYLIQFRVNYNMKPHLRIFTVHEGACNIHCV